MKKVLIEDNQLLVFKNEKPFLDTLKKQKKDEVWKRCFVNEIKVLPLYNNPIGLSALRRDMEIPCSDEILLDVMEAGRALILEFPLNKLMHVPVRDTAFTSICDRGHISGTALGKMTNDNFCKVINICLQEFKDYCLVLYRDYKISAVHSGDESDYSILNAYELVRALSTGLNRKFKNVIFENAFLTHELCSAVYLLDEPRIIEIYKPYLEKMGHERLDRFKPSIKFSTSDVSKSGANLYPYLTNGNMVIQVGTPLSLAHKHKASIADFQNNVEAVYALFEQSVKRFDELAQIELKFPADCFVNVCKKIGLANAYSSEALELFENTKKATTTALELYIALWETIATMKNNKEPETKVFTAQEKIARVLTLNIKTFDKRKEM